MKATNKIQKEIDKLTQLVDEMIASREYLEKTEAMANIYHAVRFLKIAKQELTEGEAQASPPHKGDYDNE